MTVSPTRYSRTWNRSRNDLSKPDIEGLRTAWSRRLDPFSAAAMLLESSTKTATMFCCGFRVAMLRAGCHSINSSRARNAVCRSHTAIDRALRRYPAGAATRTNRESAAGQDGKQAAPTPATTQEGRTAPFENTVGRILEQELEHLVCRLLQGRGGSMRHGIDRVVHGDPVRKRGPLLRVARIVGPLPRIAEVHVVADRHHQRPLSS